MELKPDIQKTMKRLNSQGKYDVLKNKIRGWLQTRDFTIEDLIANQKEGIISLSGGLLNKIGTLFSQGREGLNEDPLSAFVFFELAAAVNHSGANGNMAQFYFDGRAPGGKDSLKALLCCSKAVDLGLDKFMLMGEILYDRNEYSQAVSYLHRIMDVRGNKKVVKLEARNLERQCLQQQLNRVFLTANAIVEQQKHPHQATPGNNINNNQIRSNSPIRNRIAFDFSETSTRNNINMNGGIGDLMTVNQSSSTGVRDANTPVARHNSASGNYAYNGSGSFNNGSTGGYYSRNDTSVVELNSNTSSNNNEVDMELQIPIHQLPGWSSITDSIDGFDKNACVQLTARAETLELECHAIHAAMEMAVEHVHQCRRNHLSEDILDLLVHTKVHEFQDLYERVLENKEAHLDAWDAYTDIAEHTLRRQLICEQNFFNPRSTRDKVSESTARKLLFRRACHESDNLEDNYDPIVLTMLSPSSNNESNDNESAAAAVAPSSHMGGCIPSARALITAERALYELAIDIYGRAGDHIPQSTGWTAVESFGIPISTATSYNQQAQTSSTPTATSVASSPSKKDSLNNNDDAAIDAADATVDAVSKLASTGSGSSGKFASSSGTSGGSSGSSKLNNRSMTSLSASIAATSLSSPQSTKAADKSKPTTASTSNANNVDVLDMVTSPNSTPATAATAASATSTGTNGEIKKTTSASASRGLLLGSRNNTSPHFSSLPDVEYTHPEMIVIDSTFIRYRSHVRPILVPSDANLHESGFVMENMGNSNDILGFFNKITMVGEDIVYAENEKKLAQLILDFMHSGDYFTLDKLKLFNDALEEEDVKYLNTVVYYLFIKRVVKWTVSYNADQYADRMVPLASVQSRALHLITMGIITFAEALSAEGMFGVFYTDEYDSCQHGPERHLRLQQALAAAASASTIGTSSTSSASNSNGDMAVGAGFGIGTGNGVLVDGAVNRGSERGGGGGGGGGGTSTPIFRPPSLPMTNATGPNHHIGTTATTSATISNSSTGGNSSSSSSLINAKAATAPAVLSPLQRLRSKAKHINAIYQKYVVELHPHNFVPVIQYWKQHATTSSGDSQGGTVCTQTQLHEELSSTYGGAAADSPDYAYAHSQDYKSAVDVELVKLLKKIQS